MSCILDRDCDGFVKKMGHYLLLLCVLGLQLGNSLEMPPRVWGCRQVFKAKPPADAEPTWTYVYTFKDGESCAQSVTLQMTDSVVVNVTDPRNCQNFYKCQGLSCLQCGCPGEETFNPITLQCDSSNAVCECEGQESTTIITEIAISQISAEQSTQTVIIPPAQGATNTGQNQAGSTNGIVIIVVIVVLTVVILLTLIIGFCLWQRGVFPLKKEPSKHPSNNDGYLHTLPPQERHVYAEIDERTVGHNSQTTRLDEEARRQLQHTYTPPMHSNPPTTHVHPHETFVLTGAHPLRQYPQFAGYPLQSQATITQNRDLIRFSAASPESKGNFSQNNNQTVIAGCCPECAADNSSVTSCSGCSNCSALSNPTPLENQETVDRRTLLHYSHTTPMHTQLNFIGRQVYI